jgi:hypothetical protein
MGHHQILGVCINSGEITAAARLLSHTGICNLTAPSTGKLEALVVYQIVFALFKPFFH